MFTPNSPSFSLDNFEGPLELLLYLIQKDEMDVCEIMIKQLTEQFMTAIESEAAIEMSSEVLALTTTLLLIKSQKLIPQEDVENQEEQEDPRIEIIQNLIEYIRFKDAAKALSLKEEQQNAHFLRAPTPFKKETGTGLDEVDIEDLKNLFQEVLERSTPLASETIRPEEWSISDKIKWFTQFQGTTAFHEIFNNEKCQQELIVLFLALLEMLKMQKLKILKENEILYISSHEPRT